MNIVYTFDNGYTDITMTSMVSLFETNKHVSQIKVYVVDCGIDEDNLKRIVELAKNYRRGIEIRKAIDVKKKIPISLDSGFWSLVCYVRLFFAEILYDIDRVMHIDCDTIVRGNLESIYCTDLADNICAACYDCVPSSKYNAGFMVSDKYYSNGFLLFDLKRMREQKIEDEFISYIISQKGILPHLDQDVISAVLKNKMYLLPAEYNIMSPTLALNSKADKLFIFDEPYYSHHEIMQAIENPQVVHFVGYRYYSKPWSQPCYHPYDTEWRHYFSLIDGRDLSLLDRKKKKYGELNNMICFLWNAGMKIGFIKGIEQKIEIKRYRKKCMYKDDVV